MALRRVSDSFLKEHSASSCYDIVGRARLSVQRSNRVNLAGGDKRLQEDSSPLLPSSLLSGMPYGFSVVVH